MNDGVCDLTLDLAKGSTAGSEAISIKFIDVSGLQLNEFGGGINQLCRLDIVDVGHRQWDRINYEVWDFETETIRFLCRDLKILKNYTI